MRRKNNEARKGLELLVTDGMLRLIEETVMKHHTKDRRLILQYLCQDMEERYQGDALEYHLQQMRMTSTGRLLDAIDLYLLMREMEPEYSGYRIG